MGLKEEVGDRYKALSLRVFQARVGSGGKKYDAIADAAKLLAAVEDSGDPGLAGEFGPKIKRLVKRVIGVEVVDFDQIARRVSPARRRKEIEEKDIGYFEEGLRGLEMRLGSSAIDEVGYHSILTDGNALFSELSIWEGAKNIVRGGPQKKKARRIGLKLSREIMAIASRSTMYGPPGKIEWKWLLESGKRGDAYVKGLAEACGAELPKQEDKGEEMLTPSWYVFLRGKTRFMVPVALYSKDVDGRKKIPLVYCDPIETLFEGLPEYRNKAIRDLVEYMRQPGIMGMTGYKGLFILRLLHELDTSVQKELKLCRGDDVVIGDVERRVYGGYLEFPDTPVGSEAIIGRRPSSPFGMRPLLGRDRKPGTGLDYFI